jgi:hypothetical protein
MNKIILTAMAAILFVACNNATNTSSTNTAGSGAVTKTDSTNAPVMSFENPTHDFGKVNAGEKVSYEFKFKNTGKSPLIISNALASCGCTVPDYPHTPIAPGQDGAISVIFDSAGKSGVQDKVITLTSNAVPTTTQLRLTGEVK